MVSTELLDQVVSAVKSVSQSVLPFYHGEAPLDINTKYDGSSVTAADCCLDLLLRQRLEQLLPNVPILSEEGHIPTWDERQQWDCYWCVDPLDGTRGFIEGSSEFAINIALIVNNEPVLGVIYAPVKQLCYFAAHDIGAWLEEEGHRLPLAVSSVSTTTIRWLTGHFISEKLEASLKDELSFSMMRCHSAIKFGYLAQQLADCYPKIGNTFEWDIAAGQIILEEAGGAVLDFNGEALRYNIGESLINPPFLAMCDPSHFLVYLDVVKSLRRKV